MNKKARKLSSFFKRCCTGKTHNHYLPYPEHAAPALFSSSEGCTITIINKTKWWIKIKLHIWFDDDYFCFSLVLSLSLPPTLIARWTNSNVNHIKIPIQFFCCTFAMFILVVVLLRLKCVYTIVTVIALCLPMSFDFSCRCSHINFSTSTSTMNDTWFERDEYVLWLCLFFCEWLLLLLMLFVASGVYVDLILFVSQTCISPKLDHIWFCSWSFYDKIDQSNRRTESERENCLVSQFMNVNSQHVWIYSWIFLWVFFRRLASTFFIFTPLVIGIVAAVRYCCYSMICRL